MKQVFWNLLFFYIVLIYQGRENTPIKAGIYFFKIKNGNTRAKCEICSKLTMKTPEWRHWHDSDVFIVNSEQIPHIVLVFPVLTLNK